MRSSRTVFSSLLMLGLAACGPPDSIVGLQLGSPEAEGQAVLFINSELNVDTAGSEYRLDGKRLILYSSDGPILTVANGLENAVALPPGGHVFSLYNGSRPLFAAPITLEAGKANQIVLFSSPAGIEHKFFVDDLAWAPWGTATRLRVINGRPDQLPVDFTTWPFADVDGAVSGPGTVLKAGLQWGEVVELQVHAEDGFAWKPSGFSPPTKARTQIWRISQGPIDDAGHLTTCSVTTLILMGDQFFESLGTWPILPVPIGPGSR